ncbi:four helix bundle protein [Caminibacter mediatlanticus TB-2]|uniref:Four helix bundle protein n=1 Tax=Caminibacter mediatlanticus TB-2 TaxID=391592 RepID=A0ABX5VAU9_9BACT|nr:four helix bundle protein [Caminibacter mediatlanticus]QCT93936.1 four helix bundle protein [Caminibacter mediatlanticus TB-2]
MLDGNLIAIKSYNFAFNIIELYKFLSESKKEYILSKQLLRCGTSVGANIQEAQAGINKKDFIAKMSIAAKEALETRYWINLLIDSGYISKDKQKTKYILEKIESIIKILTKIIKTSQKEKNE